MPRGDSGLARERKAATAAERRHCMIAETAYLLAQSRGFACGSELDDWLAAERNIDTALTHVRGTAPDRSG